MIRKTLKIEYTGYHFNPGALGSNGVYAGTWDEKPVTKTFSIPEAKVNPALIPNEEGKIASEAYNNAYANAEAVIFDGLFYMGELTPVRCVEDTTGPVAVGLAQMFQGASMHPTSVAIYWEVVEDKPLEADE